MGGLEIGPLGGAEIEALAADGAGGTATFHQSAVWVDACAGGIAAWPLSRLLALRLGVEAVIPLSRPSFVVLEPAPQAAIGLHRPAALGGRMALGAELRFF